MPQNEFKHVYTIFEEKELEDELLFIKMSVGHRLFDIRDGFTFDCTNPSEWNDLIVTTDDYNVHISTMSRRLAMKNPKTIEQYRDYINRKQIEQASIYLPDLELLRSCPTLKHLHIYPPEDKAEFDFSPLYGMPEIRSLNCPNKYGMFEDFCSTIDYSQIKGLVCLQVEVNKATLHFNEIDTLKTLRIYDYKDKSRDLTHMFSSEQLDSLLIQESNIQSLNGIDRSKKMQCVCLYYNSQLKDISALKQVKDTLKTLAIENCPKITDFSVLNELENLETLTLFGKNVLPNLDFIKNMKKLKVFSFSVIIQDGNLEPCLSLRFAQSCVNRKWYNLKDSDLPGKQGSCGCWGYEGIETWRSLA